MSFDPELFYSSGRSIQLLSASIFCCSNCRLPQFSVALIVCFNGLLLQLSFASTVCYSSCRLLQWSVTPVVVCFNGLLLQLSFGSMVCYSSCRCRNWLDVLSVSGVFNVTTISVHAPEGKLHLPLPGVSEAWRKERSGQKPWSVTRSLWSF